MRNFLKLAQGVNIMPLLHAIQRQPELWNQNNLRREYPTSSHTEVDDIWLRFSNAEPQNIINDFDAINFPAWDKLPQAHQIIFDLMRTVEATRLGRVLITRLPPGKCIAKHVDNGKYAEYYDRYHIALCNLPGANFRAGSDVICPHAGDVYWFNRLVEHEVINHSNDDRITMIVDIRCNK